MGLDMPATTWAPEGTIHAPADEFMLPSITFTVLSSLKDFIKCNVPYLRRDA